MRKLVQSRIGISIQAPILSQSNIVYTTPRKLFLLTEDLPSDDFSLT